MRASNRVIRLLTFVPGSFVWAALVVSNLSLAANLTGGVPHALIDQLGSYLQKHNVDHRTTWKAGPPTVERPTLAPLEGYPAEVSRVTEHEFQSAFERGLTGAVVALEKASPRFEFLPSRTQSVLPQNIDEAWLQTPPEKRVFIAFTRSDVETAKIIRAALKQRGYIAYIYINDLGGKPTYSADHVGTLFRTAGHHLLIDSPSARKSPSVAYEAYWRTILPPMPRRQSDSGGSPPEDASCWKCCRYRGSIRVSCVFLGCGDEAYQRGLKTCH